MQIRVREKLEQGKGDWRFGGGIPSGYFWGRCLLQCSVASMRTLHLISGTEIDELLMSPWSIFTTWTLWVMLLIVSPSLHCCWWAYSQFWTSKYIFGVLTSLLVLSRFPSNFFPLHFVSITYVFNWLVNPSCYIPTWLCHALGDKYHVLPTHSWGRFPYIINPFSGRRNNSFHHLQKGGTEKKGRGPGLLTSLTWTQSFWDLTMNLGQRIIHIPAMKDVWNVESKCDMLNAMTSKWALSVIL